MEQMVRDTRSFVVPIMRAPTRAPIKVMRTFQILQPLRTHYVKATCEQFGCPHYIMGWKTIVPIDSPQAYYIEHDSGRKFVKLITGPGLVEFQFEPGQTCFASDTHHVPLERPAIFRMRDGDWRGNPSGRVTALSSESWVDEFGENMESVKAFHERG